MKFNYKPILLSIFILTVSFAAFAQETPPDPIDQIGGDDDPAPINTKLIWLAILGIAFAYYQFRNYRKRVA